MDYDEQRQQELERDMLREKIRNRESKVAAGMMFVFGIGSILLIFLGIACISLSTLADYGVIERAPAQTQPSEIRATVVLEGLND
jgi:hypothetical protein